MKKPQTEGLMRIGELSRAAGISVSTVKFYIKEGLISPACKTGRNMAYYHPDCVERIGLVKRLQRERYYPLSVIRRLLESPEPGAGEMALLDAIHKVDGESAGERRPPLTLKEAALQTGLSERRIKALLRAGLIEPSAEGDAQAFSDSALTVMSLARQRLDAGIPFEQTLRSFSIYEAALREAAAEDVDSFISGALMCAKPAAEQGARMIRVSDDTLDRFVKLKRNEHNRRCGSSRLDSLGRFETALITAIRAAASAFKAAGRADLAEICECAARGGRIPEQQRILFSHYLGFARDAGGNIAKSIALCVKSRDYFSSLPQAETGGAALVAACARLFWLSLAPAVIDCSKPAERAADELAALAGTELGGAAAEFLGAINNAMTTGGTV